MAALADRAHSRRADAAPARGRTRASARALLVDDRGLSTAEYVIILALICIVGFVVWQQFGGHAADRNRAAGHVVNGLATTSSVGDHHEAGGGGRGGAAGSGAVGGGSGGAGSGGAYPDLRDVAGGEAEDEGSDVWKLFVLGGAFFGAMILWLMKEKSSR